MSSVQMVSATAAAARPVATRAGAAYRDADASVGATPAPSDRTETAGELYSDMAVRSASLAEQTIRAAHEEARYAEWIERIRSSPRATSLLVQRPAPDHYRVGYPTAVAAYQEVSRLVEKL
jgi:hypothetical protein